MSVKTLLLSALAVAALVAPATAMAHDNGYGYGDRQASYGHRDHQGAYGHRGHRGEDYRQAWGHPHHQRWNDDRR